LVTEPHITRRSATVHPTKATTQQSYLDHGCSPHKPLFIPAAWTI
jgi:hypothetical protein